MRIRAACHTNEPQATASLTLSAVMVVVALHSGATWWQCGMAAAFWPIIAFMANLADPIPPNSQDR